MNFGTRQKLKLQQPLILHIDNKPLECVPFYNYLGTYLDTELTNCQAIE